MCHENEIKIEPRTRNETEVEEIIFDEQMNKPRVDKEISEIKIDETKNESNEKQDEQLTHQYNTIKNERLFSQILICLSKSLTTKVRRKSSGGAKQ
jgi:hypothetical protein